MVKVICNEKGFDYIKKEDALSKYRTLEKEGYAVKLWASPVEKIGKTYKGIKVRRG